MIPTDQFCEDTKLRTDQDPEVLYNIVFSDDATFQLNGTCNWHSCRYWAEENPQWIRESKTEYPQRIHVSAGIINNYLLDPFFIDRNLTAQRYENIILNEFVPAIREITGEHVWFQQEGAASLHGRDVLNYLDDHFPDRTKRFNRMAYQISRFNSTWFWRMRPFKKSDLGNKTSKFRWVEWENNWCWCPNTWRMLKQFLRICLPSISLLPGSKRCTIWAFTTMGLLIPIEMQGESLKTSTLRSETLKASTPKETKSYYALVVVPWLC